MAVCDDGQYFHGHADSVFQKVGLSAGVRAASLVDIVEGHKGEGYGLSTQAELGKCEGDRLCLKC